MDKLEQAYLSVSCPLCKAAPRRRCTMPNGQPYYQRTANRQKFYAFHERRKKRALVVYAFHASQYAEQRTSDPQSPPVDGGGTVIHVDFTQKKGA